MSSSSRSGVVLQAAASTSSAARTNSWTPAGSASCRRKREPLLGLIVAALREAGGRGLVLSSIYRYVSEHSADYATGVVDGGAASTTTSVGWRKNVRHILSVRNFFVKTNELNPDGRGRFWRLDELKYAEFVAERTESTASARAKRPVSRQASLTSVLNGAQLENTHFTSFCIDAYGF